MTRGVHLSDQIFEVEEDGWVEKLLVSLLF